MKEIERWLARGLPEARGLRAVSFDRKSAAEGGHLASGWRGRASAVVFGAAIASAATMLGRHMPSAIAVVSLCRVNLIGIDTLYGTPPRWQSNRPRCKPPWCSCFAVAGWAAGWDSLADRSSATSLRKVRRLVAPAGHPRSADRCGRSCCLRAHTRDFRIADAQLRQGSEKGTRKPDD